MTQFRYVTYYIVLALSLILPVKTYADDKQQSINNLGQLNGIALHCKYLALGQQIKQALVDNLPKERMLGELFDNSTNESFLEFIKQGSSCPAESAFTIQVNEAISTLEKAYNKQ
ncbi:MAG: hypothetical protein OEY89_03830 [Gammaproteobacteria bacterium]|nr:hypothetical protein [Gammaproteobacteria bacterium]